jgi:hypothetical protein
MFLQQNNYFIYISIEFSWIFVWTNIKSSIVQIRISIPFNIFKSGLRIYSYKSVVLHVCIFIWKFTPILENDGQYSSKYKCF